MLWSKAPFLEVKGSLSGYLYSTVRNRIFDQIAHGKVKAKYITSLAAFADEGECQTHYLVREKQLKGLIEQEIASLPEAMRNAFELSRKSNMSYKEIADELGISENAVRNQVSRALKVLRNRFGDMALLYFILNS
jgi:RNA polymerase sigma factor (sigma-70 family)